MGVDVQVGDRTVTIDLVKPILGVTLDRGAQGVGAPVSLGFDAQGPFPALGRIITLVCPGDGVLTAVASGGEGFAPLGPAVLKVTKNGTFVDHSQATSLEIQSALFATMTVPAGGGDLVFTYPSGGSVVKGDKLRVWGPLVSDPNLAFLAATFAGV